MPVMAVHSHRSTWQPPRSAKKAASNSPPPARPLTQLPNSPHDKPLPPPPLFAFADFDSWTDTLGAQRAAIKSPTAIVSTAVSRPVSPIVEGELKRHDSGVDIELEQDSYSNFVAGSPSLLKDSVLGGIEKKGRGEYDMSASPPLVEKRRSSSGVRNPKRKSMGPRLPVRVMSSDSHDGGNNDLKVVERPVTPNDDSSVCPLLSSCDLRETWTNPLTQRYRTTISRRPSKLQQLSLRLRRRRTRPDGPAAPRVKWKVQVPIPPKPSPTPPPSATTAPSPSKLRRAIRRPSTKPTTAWASAAATQKRNRLRRMRARR